MFVSPPRRPCSLRRSASPRFSQPPKYLVWSSHSVGKPVPGLVSTLFHHMYSVPLRSVQMFLQATEQVWQPMHLSRWKTIETCARMFMPPPFPRRRLPLEPLELAHDRIGVAGEDPDRAPVVEAVRELRLAAGEQDGVDPRAREAVVAASAPPACDFGIEIVRSGEW